MKKLSVVILIIIAVIIIGCTVFSIAKNDLTTIQSIFAKHTEVASTEVMKNNIQDEFELLSSETQTGTIEENIVENNIIENETTENSIENSNTILDTISLASIASIGISGSNIPNEVANNTVNNTIENRNNTVSLTTNNITINSTQNNITNTSVNKEKLPAAGVKTAIIWVVVILVIISIISNRKYNYLNIK